MKRKSAAAVTSKTYVPPRIERLQRQAGDHSPQTGGYSVSRLTGDKSI
jgi:hypothetical protein